MRNALINIKKVTQAGYNEYKECRKIKNGRYNSWEHCYLIFHEAHESGKVDKDLLALNLAFFLASWGMYRGSSFLLKRDYKIHIKAVEELLKDEYNSLWSISIKELKKKDNLEALNKLINNLGEIYKRIKDETKDSKNTDIISDTLISKIIMGTIGCTPAYDTYFINSIRKYSIANSSFNIKSILQIIDYYENNYIEFEEIRRKMRVGHLSYPQMRLIDSCFWRLGIDESK